MKPQEENFKSRLETLDILYKRFREGLSVLDPYSAVVFSSPMADCFLMAIAQLNDYKEGKIVDGLITDALSKESTD